METVANIAMVMELKILLRLLDLATIGNELGNANMETVVNLLILL